jgi:hypothetical protein
MLRIHFTPEDLARTTIAPEPDALWEVLLSLHMLQGRDAELVFGRWRRSARDGVARTDLLLLRDLAPPMGYSPDFLTPAGGGPHLDDALDRVLATGHARVRAELDHLASRRPPTVWTRALAGGGSGAMRRLGTAVRTYHEAALAPYWQSVRRHVVADRTRRAEQLVSKGVDHVLSNLHPRVRWERSVLTVLDFSDAEVHLDGRGLLLQPSFFCWQAPTKLRDNSLPPVLVYPTQPPPGTLQVTGPGDSEQGASPLAALIGRTRAMALEMTVTGCTTSEMARLCSISVAAASQQASVLRDAALITTRRHGIAVWHEITALGLSLLDGAGPTGAMAASHASGP